MDRDTLQQLSKDELIAHVLGQADALARFAEQVSSLTERIAAPKAKLGLPPKTPDNSSVPPSRGQKLNRVERRAAKSKGRPVHQKCARATIAGDFRPGRRRLDPSGSR